VRSSLSSLVCGRVGREDQPAETKRRELQPRPLARVRDQQQRREGERHLGEHEVPDEVLAVPGRGRDCQVMGAVVYGEEIHN
jgi:hypothetical protein